MTELTSALVHVQGRKMGGGAGELKVAMLGPFKVATSDGRDLTPRNRKSCALLAILALSPGRRRSRAAVQDKLWSQFPPEKGAANLRQSLSEIRHSLGDYRAVIQADHRTIALSSEVQVDVENLDFARIRQQPDRALPDLLEDLDIQDPEFDDWLRDQRTALLKRVELIVNGVSDEPRALQLASRSFLRSASANRPWVHILQSPVAQQSEDPVLSTLVAEAAARGLADAGIVDVREMPGEPPGIKIRVRATRVSASVVVHLTLLSAIDDTQLWSGIQIVPSEQLFIPNSPELMLLINQSIDIAARQLRRLQDQSEVKQSFALAFDAIQRIFKVDKGELLAADELLRKAGEASPHGLYLAWRAYARTLQVGEGFVLDREEKISEAERFARQALESAPDNATVLALTAHVHSFLLRKFHVGHELAEASIRLSSTNPLAYAYLGRAKAYLGHYDEAFKLAKFAREVAGIGPLRFTLDSNCGIMAMLAGKFDLAIHLGEFVREIAPNYRPVQRYLVPLYLCLGQRDKAREVYGELRRLEPGFSLDAMREQSYPNAALKVAGLLRFTDADL